MAVQQLSFQGINRAITDFATTGACEELINLRPTTGGLVPVKPFSTKIETFTGNKIFVHPISTGENYIAYSIPTRSPNTISFYWIDESGTSTNLYSLSQTTTGFTDDDIHFAYAGNYILFSINAGSDDSRYCKNIAFLWNGTTYTQVEAEAPDIVLAINENGGATKFEKIISTLDPSTITNDELADKLESIFNQIREENRYYCFAPFLIAVALKTRDGEILWTYRWCLYDPADALANASGYYATSSTVPTATDFWARYSEGYHVGVGAVGYHTIQYYGVRPTLTVHLDTTTWNESTSMIESVEVYTSMPTSHADTQAIAKGLEPVATYFYNGSEHVLVPKTQNVDYDLDSQLLYLQQSIPLSSLAEDDVTIDLDFGGNIQTANRTLEVDAGMVTRYGNILAYNARFHFYDSTAKTEFEMPQFTFSGSSSTAWDLHEVFILFNDGTKDQRLYLGTTLLLDENASLVLASSIRIKEITTQYYSSGDSLWHMRTYTMTESSTYNYSICIDGGTYEYYPVKKWTPSESPVTSIYTDEPSAINVTEQYNPFVFNVQHSYLAPGKVLDLQPQMVGISDVEFGFDPLNVFTNRGAYALRQGDGTVLYAGFTPPLSNLVSTSNSVSTESGTFFLAAGGLWSIVGRRAVLISDALSLGPHKYIRDCDGYINIRSEALSAPYQTPESQVTFEEFVSGAHLVYNRHRDELIISNPTHIYSYVLSLKYRQWFKITGRFTQDSIGGDISRSVRFYSGQFIGTVVDFSDETENTTTPVHLQSRPFSFTPSMYSHIHRVVSFIRGDLGEDEILIVALYGSDNLQDWKLLAYSDRTDVKFSQIRTPAAARSWRYYTICISGTIPTETDFGATMVEYIPVTRRIG